MTGCTYDGTVANLDGLQHVQHELSALAGEDQTVAGSGSAVDLVGEVDGLKRGGQVGDDTGHTNVESLLGDLLKAESVLDDFLYSHCAIRIPIPIQKSRIMWGIGLNIPPQTSYRPSCRCPHHPIVQRKLAIDYPAYAIPARAILTLAEDEA